MAEKFTRINSLRVAEKRIERLEREIEEKKWSVKERFTRFREMLDLKENEINEKLDAILTEVISPVTHRKNIIAQLIEGTSAMEGRFEHNELHRLRTETIGRIAQEIEVLENKPIEEIPSTKLKWNMELIERAFTEVCQVILQPCPYEERETALMACGNKGRGEQELWTPSGIAIDEENGNIFIADQDMNRIQVFSQEGSYLTTIPDIDYPRRLVLDSFHCFITCNISGGLLVKINRQDNKIVKQVSEEEYISDIEFDPQKRIVGCVYDKLQVFVWDKELECVKRLSLHAEYFEKGKSKIQKIVPTATCIFVLFTLATYPLQSFGWNGFPLKSIIYNDQLCGAKMFTIDNENRFVVVNNKGHEVKIFSPEGKHLTSIGSKGTEKGQFLDPLSIAILPCGRILVVDTKESAMIQLF